MKRRVVKYTYCIFLLIALFALYLLYAFKVPIINAVPRCSHKTNYFKGYDEKGSVKFKAGGGCGCGKYYKGLNNWAYFVHKDDGANTSKDSYENGLPKGSHKKDFKDGKLPSITDDPGTCAPAGLNVSCYFRDWGNATGERNYVLANKGITQDGKESKWKDKDDADFCPGHGFRCDGNVRTKEPIWDGLKVWDEGIWDVDYEEKSFKLGALKRTGNKYTMYHDTDYYYWDDCCQYGVEEAKSKEKDGVVEEDQTELEKCHTSFDMWTWDNDVVRLIPNTKGLIVDYIVTKDPTAAFYGHDLMLVNNSKYKVEKPARPCQFCTRVFPTSKTVNPGDKLEEQAFNLKKAIKSGELTNIKAEDKKFIDMCISLHHWLRPEMYNNGDISDLTETTHGKNPEKAKTTFTPFMFGTQIPFQINAACALDASFMHGLSVDKATTSAQRKEIRRRSACGHVERVSSSHMIVAFHISNLLDSNPTENGNFMSATSDYESVEDLVGTSQLLKTYMLEDACDMEYPEVECAKGKIIKSWQASPLPDDASSDLHAAYAPNSKNYKFYCGEGYNVQLVHSLLTGLLDTNSGVKSKKVKTLKDSKYALHYVAPGNKADGSKCDYVTKGSTDSLLIRSMENMLLEYSDNDVYTDMLILNAYNDLPLSVLNLNSFSAVRDRMVSQMISRNIDAHKTSNSKPLTTDGGTELNKQKTVLNGAFSDVGDDTITVSLSTILSRGLYYNFDIEQYTFIDSVREFADYYGGAPDAASFANDIDMLNNVKFAQSIGTVENKSDVINNIKSFPKINQLTSSIVMFYSYEDETDEDTDALPGESEEKYFSANYLPKFTAYNTATGDIMMEQYNVQRFAMDALTGQQMGAEAQSNPLTAVNLYGNIAPMRYVVNQEIDGMNLISPYVMPDDMEGTKTSTEQYKAAAKSSLYIEDTDGNLHPEEEYISIMNPSNVMYYSNSNVKVRFTDWSELEHEEDDVMYYGLLLYGWWYGEHFSANTGTSEGGYTLYGKPHLRDKNGHEWYYTSSDQWNVMQDGSSSGTYSPWLLKQKTFDFGATIPTNKDMCSASVEQDYSLSNTANTQGEQIYGQADLYVELKPKSYSIRYIVNDKYANAFDKTCPESGKDNYFEDKNYYDGKAHYFDATKDTPVNYHDRKQGSSANRGTKWETGGNYPKAYKQGYYLAGWQYYGDDFHEYGTEESDDKNNPTGFIAAGDKIKAFQYYPKYESTSKNVAYLYAVWKPYEYTITYKKGDGDSGAEISQKKPFGVFYEAEDTGEDCYDLFTNTVGTFESTPRRSYTYKGKTYQLDIDVNMTSAPHFKKFGYYISSWEGKAGTTNSTEKKQETGDFKKSEYYESGWGATWESGLNKLYVNPKSGTKYTPEGGTTTQSNAHNTKAKAKYLRIDEDIVIPGDETYNHLPEDIEPRGHNLKVTYTAKWSPILYNVVYKQDTSGDNGAVSVGGDIMTGNYTFGKVYSTHKNPTSADSWARYTPGGTSVWKGWCFVDGDTGLHPHYTAGNATNVTEVSTSTEESSRGANFYTKSKTQGSWYRGMGQWGSPYTDDHNYGESKIHGGNTIIEDSKLTYTQYFDYLHDDVDRSANGKLGSFPLYGVWDDKRGWEPQDLIWSFQKMESLINSNGGRNSTNAMLAVERVLREAEAASAGPGAQDREHNDAAVASDTYTKMANTMKLFEFEAEFEDICKQTFDKRYANTEGRAASTFSLNWYYASTDPTVKPDQTNTTFYRRKLYLTDSTTWRNLQIERQKANGQAVTQNANLPWCQNFYKTGSGRATTDYASDSLDDLIDKY